MGWGRDGGNATYSDILPGSRQTTTPTQTPTLTPANSADSESGSDSDSAVLRDMPDSWHNSPYN